METVGSRHLVTLGQGAQAGRRDRDLRGDQRRSAPAELTRVFFLQLSVVGSTMGTRDELERLMRLMVQRQIQPVISQTLPLSDARAGFEAMLEGNTSGKIVVTV